MERYNAEKARYKKDKLNKKQFVTLMMAEQKQKKRGEKVADKKIVYY